MGNKKIWSRKHDGHQINVDEIRGRTKERMRRLHTTLREQQDKDVGPPLVDPTPIEADIGNFLTSFFKC